MVSKNYTGVKMQIPGITQTVKHFDTDVNDFYAISYS